MESWRKELYLEHHGILGQKWGKRNGPPYPLGASNHSASEKKAGWRKSLDKDNAANYTKSSSSGSNGIHLTENQKKALKIGATVAVTALAAYGAYRLNQSGKLSQFVGTGRDAVDSMIGGSNGHVPSNTSNQSPSKVDSATGFKLKTNSGPRTIQSIADDVRAINPSGNGTNCVACAVTYDLRAKGYDVVAKSRENGQVFRIGELDLLYDDFKREKLKTSPRDIADAYDQVSKRLLSYGEGSHGILTGVFNEAGKSWFRSMGLDVQGHAVSWEVLNGKLVISDGQNGKVYADPFKQLIRNFEKDELSFGRLDNLEIDPEFVKIFAQNR